MFYMQPLLQMDCVKVVYRFLCWELPLPLLFRFWVWQA